MAGAGAPEGLPLNFRFSPAHFLSPFGRWESEPDSPTLQWGTLILVTPAEAGVMRCLFLFQMLGRTSVLLKSGRIIPEKRIGAIVGNSRANAQNAAFITENVRELQKRESPGFSGAFWFSHQGAVCGWVALVLGCALAWAVPWCLCALP